MQILYPLKLNERARVATIAYLTATCILLEYLDLDVYYSVQLLIPRPGFCHLCVIIDGLIMIAKILKLL